LLIEKNSNLRGDISGHTISLLWCFRKQEIPSVEVTSGGDWWIEKGDIILNY